MLLFISLILEGMLVDVMVSPLRFALVYTQLSRSHFREKDYLYLRRLACYNQGRLFMDRSDQVVRYLDELAQVLLELHVTTPFHLLVAGGAYMLINSSRRTTLDIDFVLIDLSQEIQPNQVFPIVLKKAEIFKKKSAVPYATEFRQAVEMVARRHRNLLDDFINDEAAFYLYDGAPYCEAIFWRSFRKLVYIYLPTAEYMLALKIAAYRPKDFDDIQVLLQRLRIREFAQAKAIIDKFILPEAQTFYEVEERLEILFSQ